MIKGTSINSYQEQKSQNKKIIEKYARIAIKKERDYFYCCHKG